MSTKQPPIARPVIEIRSQGIGRERMHWVVCDHCPYRYGPTPAKTDAAAQASRHRAAHRAGQVDA